MADRQGQGKPAKRAKRPAARASARSGVRPVTSPRASQAPGAKTRGRRVAARRARTAPPPAVRAAIDAAAGSRLPDQPEAARAAVDARRRAATAIEEVALRASTQAALQPPSEDHLRGTARQLLSTDYYLRQIGRLGMRGRSERVDDYGLDRTYERRLKPALDLLHDRYFRVQLEGVEHLPREGAALLVCNHSGALPWDGLVLRTAVRRGHRDGRALRFLVQDFVFHAPFVGPFLTRLGAVRACQENAQRLLADGELLAVFPEGVQGIGKRYSQRYRLQRFGRGGHVRLALRTGVPIIPVAIVGAEETHPLLYRVERFAKLAGLPFIPVTPTFPWLGPLGLLPLPSRWRIEIGPAFAELAGLAAQDADDTLRVNELNESLRNTLQAMVDGARQARGPRAFF